MSSIANITLDNRNFRADPIPLAPVCGTLFSETGLSDTMHNLTIKNGGAEQHSLRLANFLCVFKAFASFVFYYPLTSWPPPDPDYIELYEQEPRFQHNQVYLPEVAWEREIRWRLALGWGWAYLVC